MVHLKTGGQQFEQFLWLLILTLFLWVTVNSVMGHVIEMPLRTFLTPSEIAYTTHPYVGRVA